jgi:hypothetical protein
MAEYRIPVQMDIIGTGDTDEAAAQAANAQFLDVVQAFNGSYNGEAEPLDESGAPTAAAVAFTRQQVNRYISEVVVGWRRRKALEAAESAVSGDGVVMQ